MLIIAVSGEKKEMKFCCCCCCKGREKGRWRLLLTHIKEGDEAVEVWRCDVLIQRLLQVGERLKLCRLAALMCCRLVGSDVIP